MPTTLARLPYGRVVAARTAYRYAPLRYRVAARVIRTAWKHRRGIKRAARHAIKSFKNKRVKRAARIGHNPGTGTTKKSQLLKQDLTGIDTRTLYQVPVTAISETTPATGNAIDRRQRAIINYRGYRADMIFVNQADAPVQVNIALITSDKAPDLTTAGFFRDYGESRDINFSTGLAHLNFNNPINTDKFTQHFRTRFQLEPWDGGGSVYNSSNFKRNWRKFQKYFKINRQIRFNDDTTTSPEDRVWLCYWCDKMDAALGSAVVPNQVAVAGDNHAFWKEPRCC